MRGTVFATENFSVLCFLVNFFLKLHLSVGGLVFQYPLGLQTQILKCLIFLSMQ